MDERVPTTVAGGFLLPECARWHDGALWFVDMLRGNVHGLAGGAVEHFASFERPSSLGFRPNGDMLIVDGSKAVLHTYRDGTLVESLDLSAFGRLNDMAMDRHGRAYIDGGGGGAGAEGGLGNWEPVGKIVMVPPDGDPWVVAEHIASPNGIGISPDGRTLVVGESMGQGGSPSGARMFGYDIANDGSLSGQRTICALARGTVDGLCLDAEGAVWISTAFGHEVQRFVGGEVVDRVPVADRKWPLACTLGGPEMRTLFICTAAAPPKGDPSKFTDGWIEAVDVEVPAPSSW